VLFAEEHVKPCVLKMATTILGFIQIASSYLYKICLFK